jgi:hypothetical protein
MNTNAFSNQKHPFRQIEIFLYRAPKKNYDEWVEINRQSRDFFIKHGASGFEVFILANRKNVMEFENLSKTISAVNMMKYASKYNPTGIQSM